MAEEKKLSVENLTISFRTSSGKLQAVRDINFDLYKGETLAIVGESGSGKSVTSRAIMGILAGNSILEGGKILYGDKDLLKISEEEFHKIRGDKIAMVFQDPLSSLNPIVRVGNQLTEAMLLKNKATRRESKKRMEDLFKALHTNMLAATGSSDKEDIDKFHKFELKHCELEKVYTTSFAYAQEAASLSDHLVLKLKNRKTDGAFKDELNELVKSANLSCTYFVVREKESQLKAITGSLKEQFAEDKKNAADKENIDYSKTIAQIEKLGEIVKEAITFEVPNTFTLGYYLTFVKPEIPAMSVEELNKLTYTATTDQFMAAFMKKIEAGVKYSSNVADEARKHALEVLKAELPKFSGDIEEKTCRESAKVMKEAVIKCLDQLEIKLDSLTHTFASSIDYAIDLYFGGIKKNAAEDVRFAKQQAKYDALVAKGKNPEWQIIPKSYVNVERAKQDISDTIKEMIAHYEEALAENANADFAERTLEVIDALKANAQASVYRVTKRVAKEKAIKLMESVGIDEPRRRFRQYPFEFSGGMRQRIVIAIALTADPDILICDEPTTALDVTIQAQILELINKLKEERNLSIIFITHDLGVVANMADRIAVMYAGKIVEYGKANEVFYAPAHPYTWALLSSIPDLDTKEKLESIPGTPPNMIYPPKGDAFADRNKYALELDFEMQPPMFKITDSHYAATWLLHPEAPKVEPPEIVTARINKMRAKRDQGGAQ